jgi:hypothetical protein
MTPEIVLAVMLTLVQSWEDRAETPEQRSALLAPLATAIAQESRSSGDAAALIAIAHGESGGFARWVVEGRCHERPAMCDKGKSRGPMQVRAWCKATDLRGEVACAAQAYRFALTRCGSPVQAFGQYASGNSCYPMSKRETTRVMVLRRLHGV